MAWTIANGVLQWTSEDSYLDWDSTTSTIGRFTTSVPRDSPVLPFQFDDLTEFDAAVAICSAESWDFRSRSGDGGGTVYLPASRLAALRAFLALPRPVAVKPYEASIPLPVERPPAPPESVHDARLDEAWHQAGAPSPDGATLVGKLLASLRDYWRR